MGGFCLLPLVKRSITRTVKSFENIGQKHKCLKKLKYLTPCYEETYKKERKVVLWRQKVTPVVPCFPASWQSAESLAMQPSNWNMINTVWSTSIVTCVNISVSTKSNHTLTLSLHIKKSLHQNLTNRTDVNPTPTSHLTFVASAVHLYFVMASLCSCA